MLYFLFLFASLTDPVFEARDSAATRLNQLVDRNPAIYGPRLAELVAGSTEPEIRSATRSALATYHRWRINSFVPTTAPVWPSIDYKPMTPAPLPFFGDCEVWPWSDWDCEWLRLPDGFYDYSHPPGEAYYWPYRCEHRAATERMIRDMLRKGATHAEADDLVGRMWRLEKAGLRYSKTVDEWVKWDGGYPQPKGGTSEP